jgi:hypothetical protein
MVVNGVYRVYSMSGNLLASCSNLVTSKLLDKVADLLAGRSKKLSLDQLIVSDVETAPATSDTIDDFIGTSINWYVHRFEDVIPMGLSIVCTALLAFEEFNFTWKRIGTLDSYGNLLSETLFDFSGKNSDNAIRIVYTLEVSEGS